MYTSFTLIILIKINKNCNTLYLYLLLGLFSLDLQNTTYNISTYYTLIQLLNSKTNLFLLSIFILLVKKGSSQHNFYNVVFLIVFLNFLQMNLFLGEIYKNIFINGILVTNLNSNLLNGLMLIHPIILYIFYLFYVKTFIVKNLKKYTKVLKVPDNKNKPIKVLLHTYISIILGC